MSPLVALLMIWLYDLGVWRGKVVYSGGWMDLMGWFVEPLADPD